jgi:acyl carrier protein
LLEQTLSPLAMWQGPAPAPNADAPPQAAAPEEAAAVAEPTPALEPTAVAEPAAVLDRRTVHQLLVAALAEATGLAPGQIDPARPFAEYGVDSASAVRIVGDLERRLARALPVTLLWDYPNITELAAHLAHPRAAGEPAVPGPAASAGLAEPIAIIGIGCRFPGASGPRRLWQLLLDGVSAISEVPAERWTVAADAAGEPTARWGGFVDDIDRFDAGFFGISPREATRMDPQQRMLLEVA